MKIRILNIDYNPESKYKLFTPTYKIKNGRMLVSELKPCKENKFYFTKQNEKDIYSIQQDFGHKLSLGIECPNHEPIIICPKTKTVWSGHNRLEAAKRAGVKYVNVIYANYVYDRNDLNDSQIKKILQSYNKFKRNEQGLGNLWIKLESIMINKKVSSKEKEQFCQDWRIHNADFNTLKSIVSIEDGRVRNKIINNLDKEIPHFKELGKKIREAKLKKPKPPKHYFPWIKFYLKYPELLIDTLKETVMKMRVEMLLKDSRTNKEHKKHWGPKAITPLVSHTTNDSHCTTMKLQDTIGRGCEMESKPLNSDKEQYDFDLYYPRLERLGYDYKEEVKSKASDTELPVFVFGPGGSRIEKPQPYVFIEYSRDMQSFYMMYAMITGKDVKSGALDINKYIKNHDEDEDYILVHGNINEENIIEGVEYEV